jgi:hypothetical protein
MPWQVYKVCRDDDGNFSENSTYKFPLFNVLYSIIRKKSEVIMERFKGQLWFQFKDETVVCCFPNTCYFLTSKELGKKLMENALELKCIKEKLNEQQLKKVSSKYSSSDQPGIRWRIFHNQFGSNRKTEDSISFPIVHEICLKLPFKCENIVVRIKGNDVFRGLAKMNQSGMTSISKNGPWNRNSVIIE